MGKWLVEALVKITELRQIAYFVKADDEKAAKARVSDGYGMEQYIKSTNVMDTEYVQEHNWKVKSVTVERILKLDNGYINVIDGCEKIATINPGKDSVDDLVNGHPIRLNSINDIYRMKRVDGLKVNTSISISNGHGTWSLDKNGDLVRQ